MTIKLNQKAQVQFELMKALGHRIGEQPTTILYLLYLGSIYPKQATFPELEEALDISKSQVGRSSRALHKVTHRGAPGADLINISFDLYQPKHKLVELNNAGLGHLRKILQA